MNTETWAAPEYSMKYRITVSRDGHVVTVRGAAYFISLVTVEFTRTGPEWESPRVQVVGASRRGGHSDTVWTLKQLDKVPEWLEGIVSRATLAWGTSC